MASHFESWGRYPQRPQVGMALDVRAFPTGQDPLLCFGMGRSYGDLCLNSKGRLLDTKWLDHFLAFDPGTGVLRAEGGVTLDQIIQLCLSQGWFPPVTPGTKFVTLGGAIANDVHGKNHHVAGTFGRHVRQFLLWRSDGSQTLCSATENPELFAATIGGLGLTGVILWAELQLKPLASAWLNVETQIFENLDAFSRISAEANAKYEYTVAWLDATARGSKVGRGAFFCGNHATETQAERWKCHKKPRLSMPLDAPSWLLNPLTIGLFNRAYLSAQGFKRGQSLQHYEPFFYPLDVCGSWNRFYGKRGFFQFQCVVPADQGLGPIRELLELLQAFGSGSFLSVLKDFGSLRSPGLMSFPQPGYTLALDFPNQGEKTLQMLDAMGARVQQLGGRIYPAKDARMSAAQFQDFYPQHKAFAALIDPRFTSDFWNRVGVTRDSH